MPAPFALDFPATILNQVRSSRFELATINQSSRALYAPKITYSGPLAQYWTASIPLQNLPDAQWRALEGFFAGLDLNRGLCRLFDPKRQKPRGRVCNPVTGTDAGELWGDDLPWADGTLWTTAYLDGMRAGENARAFADTLLMEGGIADAPLAVAAGDLFEINRYLYMATADTMSDGDGRCRVSLRPRLREPVALGDQIKFGRASVAMRLTNAEVIGIDRASITEWASAALNFVEVIEG